ncbi:TIM barrel protein [Microbacterium chocolatum]|uniref:TIM barrel protein n=1 Tax=Microbacterium aurantiacum TaxID=162393 RepID=UPI0033903273
MADLARSANLDAVEWGTDVHVPLDDALAQDHIREWAGNGGPAVASLGTYFRADPSAFPGEIDAIIAAARRADAPRVRVWAGAQPSESANFSYRSMVVGKVRELAEAGAEAALTVGIELHEGTLADTEVSAARLLDEIDRPNVGSYWQPGVGIPAAHALSGLHLLVDRVVAVHAFSWWPSYERQTLSARPALWRPAFDLLRSQNRPLDVLLEFVPNDDPSLLAREADALRGLIQESS